MSLVGRAVAQMQRHKGVCRQLMPLGDEKAQLVGAPGVHHANVVHDALGLVGGGHAQKPLTQLIFERHWHTSSGCL